MSRPEFINHFIVQRLVWFWCNVRRDEMVEHKNEQKENNRNTSACDWERTDIGDKIQFYSFEWTNNPPEVFLYTNRFFPETVLYVHSERPQKTINKKRHKRDGASKGIKRKSYKEVKKLGCRLRRWHLDFNQVMIWKSCDDYQSIFLTVWNIENLIRISIIFIHSLIGMIGS